MSDINEIKQALEDVNVLPWQYRELHRTIEYDAIQDSNGKNIICIFSYDQANVDFLLLAVNNISSLITTIESKTEQFEKLKVHAEHLQALVNGQDQSHTNYVNETETLIEKKDVLIESQKEEIAELLRVNSVKSQQLFEKDLEISLLEKDIQDWHLHYNGRIHTLINSHESLKAITELAVKGLRHYADETFYEFYGMGTMALEDKGDAARSILAEIERLTNELAK